MTVSTVKGVEVTKLDTTPRTLLEAGSATGKQRVFMDTIAVLTASTDEDGDIIMLAEIPSNAKIQSIKMFNDDLDSDATPALAANLGIYNGQTPFINASGSEVAAAELIDEDAYASATTALQAAVTTGTELAFEARDIDEVANYVWEDAGLTQDPKVPLRIALTITTAAATHADGDITLIVTYTES